MFTGSMILRDVFTDSYNIYKKISISYTQLM